MQIKVRGDNLAGLHAIADALIDKALTGDVAACREFADRYDGKVPRAVEDPEEITVVIRDLADTLNDEDKARANALMARQMVSATGAGGVEEGD
jgi:hypothetical protein